VKLCTNNLQKNIRLEVTSVSLKLRFCVHFCSIKSNYRPPMTGQLKRIEVYLRIFRVLAKHMKPMTDAGVISQCVTEVTTSYLKVTKMLLKNCVTCSSARHKQLLAGGHFMFWRMPSVLLDIMSWQWTSHVTQAIHRNYSFLSLFNQMFDYFVKKCWLFYLRRLLIEKMSMTFCRIPKDFWTNVKKLISVRTGGTSSMVVTGITSYL
jgi:hypothetical protein